jgi:hypothetical protein
MRENRTEVNVGITLAIFLEDLFALCRREQQESDLEPLECQSCKIKTFMEICEPLFCLPTVESLQLEQLYTVILEHWY